jgi:hypothetical protein
MSFPTDDTNMPSPEELRAKRRREAEERFHVVISEIRDQPGFEKFLLPATADELMTAADPNPIAVINISSYRCDALLIQRHCITSLNLQKLSLEDVKAEAKNMKSSRASLSSTLAWLWDVIALDCLEALGFKQAHSRGNWPHVWWIPTGALSYFPLHAAGRHFGGSKETVLDRVISSYSSSIKALLHGRRPSVYKPTSSIWDQALLVCMQETPEQPTLRFAAGEVKMLEEFCPSLQLQPVRLNQQRREDVLAGLRTCKVLHFAGHGESDLSEPSRSCLLLEDWKTNPLTVADLRDHWFHSSAPLLAYLSACSTGSTRAEKLIDEAIHLMSACQLAGFRHVVGTLWEADDRYSVDAAREVYKAIQNNGWGNEAVALGVHNAARILRAKTSRLSWGTGYAVREEGDPSIWATYVHVGTIDWSDFHDAT